MLTAYGRAARQSGHVRWLQRLLLKSAACGLRLRPPGACFKRSDVRRAPLVVQINRWLEPPSLIQPAAQPVLSCRCPSLPLPQKGHDLLRCVDGVGTSFQSVLRGTLCLLSLLLLSRCVSKPLKVCNRRNEILVQTDREAALCVKCCTLKRSWTKELLKTS